MELDMPLGNLVKGMWGCLLQPNHGLCTSDIFPGWWCWNYFTYPANGFARFCSDNISAISPFFFQVHLCCKLLWLKLGMIYCLLCREWAYCTFFELLPQLCRHTGGEDEFHHLTPAVITRWPLIIYWYLFLNPTAENISHLFRLWNLQRILAYLASILGEKIMLTLPVIIHHHWNHSRARCLTMLCMTVIATSTEDVLWSFLIVKYQYSFWCCFWDDVGCIAFDLEKNVLLMLYWCE